MIESVISELHESNDLLVGAAKRYVRGCPEHRVEEFDGVCFAHSGTLMAFLNFAALTSPARDLEDLEGRVRAARERAEAIGLPWLLALCDDWTPGGDGVAAHALLARSGMQRVMTSTGMVTDALAAPRRSAPEQELRRVGDEETRFAVSDLNCVSYGLPLPLGRATFAAPGLWGEDMLGRVGYVGGEAVSCAATLVLEGRLYVGFVATAAEHRRKGYAEGVMRSSLADAMEATGLQRTALHASEIGRPLYEAMGYRAVARFSYYASAQGQEPEPAQR